MSGVSNEFSELPTTPEHEQTTVNQSDRYLAPLRPPHHSRKLVREDVLLPTQKII